MIQTKFLSLIPIALFQTLTMIGVTVFFSVFLGFMGGIYLYFVDKKIIKKSFFSKSLGLLIDSIRSFPFSIFIITLLPLSKWILGSSFGIRASFIPMILAGGCYFARLCHQTFHTLPKEMLEAAILMGFSKKDLALKLVLKETLPMTIQNIALLATASLGFSTMAGLVGAGGLGKLAMDYGYYRFNLPILLINIFIILLIGRAIQYFGELGFKKLMIKRGLYAKS
jgi:D-methionine transport system permease protein